MDVTIKQIDDKQVWEDFLLSHENPPFLQSWNTAEQYEAMGDKTLRLGIYNDGALTGVALVILTRAKRGSYLYLPYGPVLTEWQPQYLQALTKHLTTWGRENKFDFIRVAPFIEKTQQAEELFKEAGYKLSPIHVLAEVLWVLDLDKSEEDLMMGMRKTNRNLVRRAVKDGVVVEQSTDKEDVDKFLELLKETSVRHHFIAYSDKLIHEQVKQFTADDQVLVMKGSHDNKLISSSVVMFYGKAASYHHGASIRSKVPVSYLVQWKSILEAMKRGCKEYNFWGIVDTEDKKHPFYGITHFKKGFGGRIKYLLAAQDYPLTKKYYFNYLVESARRIKRGFGLKRSH